MAGVGGSNPPRSTSPFQPPLNISSRIIILLVFRWCAKCGDLSDDVDVDCVSGFGKSRVILGVKVT